MNWRSVERRAQSRKGEMRRAGQKERRTAASLAEFWQKVVVRVHRRQASAAARLSETLPSPLRGSDLPDPVCHRLPPATMKQQKNIWVAAGDGDLERVRELIEHQGDSPNARDPFTYTPMFVFSRSHRHPHSFFYQARRSLLWPETRLAVPHKLWYDSPPPMAYSSGTHKPSKEVMSI